MDFTLLNHQIALLQGSAAISPRRNPHTKTFLFEKSYILVKPVGLYDISNKKVSAPFVKII